LCERYLGAGHHVIAHHWRNSQALDSLASASDHLETLQLDLGDLAAVGAAASSFLASCDVIVCLASLAEPTSIENLDFDTLRRTINIGALSNYIIMGAVGPSMAQRGWGRIVIGSSIGVRFGGGTDSFAYSLANHTSEFIPRTARDWATNNVLTNVVRIGVTETSLHGAFPRRDLKERALKIPMQRMATTDEIADYLFWLGSDRNTFITGQVTAISGGE
jgi:NAD(P)-dependent dehydrogenase (short-subunit alcohol dehydrogenase family)